MAYSFDLINLLIFLRRQGYIERATSVMEIGTQQLAANFAAATDELQEVGRLFGVERPLSLPIPERTHIVHGELQHLDEQAPWSREFWRWLGFDYASIDVDGSPGSIPIDLNFDSVPANAVGKYQLVTNYGTTEHVANQLNAFKIIHELTALGGLMVHELPAQGHVNHGLITYNFNFFFMLSRSNGYKVVLADYRQSPQTYHLPDSILRPIRETNPHHHPKLPEFEIADGSIKMVLQKIYDIPYVPPIDVPPDVETGLSEQQKRRYWTVFEPNAFARLRPNVSAGARIPMNDMEQYREAFAGLKPWSGHVPQGHLADFLGTFTDVRFRPMSGFDRSAVGGGELTTELPKLGGGQNGEGWFEAVNWIAAAKEARERLVMISLGAHYGAQLVGAHHMLRLVNPLPCTLVAVEAEPENFAWISDHMRDNGIDPTAHWLVQKAVSDSEAPVLFPVGAPGVGSNNCFSTNGPDSRQIYADLIIRDADPKAALRSILADNTTGFTQPVHPGLPQMTEVKFISAITLGDLLAPFDRVDFVEADIQQSEILVFPPFMDALRKKVRRIHIGTHSNDVHEDLQSLFADEGWDIVFSFKPNAQYECALGKFELNDGILTVRNPTL